MCFFGGGSSSGGEGFSTKTGSPYAGTPAVDGGDGVATESGERVFDWSRNGTTANRQTLLGSPQQPTPPTMGDTPATERDAMRGTMPRRRRPSIY